jgi:hypothetical protein
LQASTPSPVMTTRRNMLSSHRGYLSVYILIST